MRIRKASARDLDVVTELRLRFLAEHRGIDRAAIEQATAVATRVFIQKAEAGGRWHSWLAESAAETVGIVSTALFEVPPLPGELRTREALMLNMYVPAGHRRKGVGGELFDTCLTDVPALGVRRLQLVATDDGRRLYQSRGFAATGDRMELTVPAPL